jgi:hypothetical protein
MLARVLCGGFQKGVYETTVGSDSTKNKHIKDNKQTRRSDSD